MQILGIDYGRAKLGLAIASTIIAEPYQVFRYKKVEEALRKVAEVVEGEKVEEVVLGISEGKMAGETREFGENLRNKLEVPVVYQDETLSTQDAQQKAISSGMKRKKRKEMEDAYAAAVMLQDYLDNL